MASQQTFTVAELEALSGFDRRTIAYYIAEGLLPKVGRRGPRTRYGEAFRDRLLLIRRIKNLQDAGRAPAATLAEIRTLLDALTPEAIRALAAGEAGEAELAAFLEDMADQGAGEDTSDAEPVAHRAEVLRGPGPLVRQREFAAADDGDVNWSLPAAGRDRSQAASGRRERLFERIWRPGQSRPAAAMAMRESAPSGPDEFVDPEQGLRDQLRELDRRATAARKRIGLTSSEPLVRVPITKNVLLTVRGLTSAEDREFAEEVAALLARYFD